MRPRLNPARHLKALSCGTHIKRAGRERFSASNPAAFQHEKRLRSLIQIDGPVQSDSDRASVTEAQFRIVHAAAQPETGNGSGVGGQNGFQDKSHTLR
jgi:hypothetical protein